MKCKSEMAASRAAAKDGGEDEEDGGISTGIWVLIVIAVARKSGIIYKQVGGNLLDFVRTPAHAEGPRGGASYV